ncbi:MAG: acyl-CoA dehydrogenase family protein [Methylococcales bacterium]|nr:acyl-CoA dehydrogenase family protein [Methylococcales bacterium]
MNYDFSQIPAQGDKYASRLRLRHCGRLQFLKHAVSVELGGHGDSFEALVMAHHSLGKQCLDSGLILSINAHLWGAIFPLITYGSIQQRQRWLPALLSGEMIGGHAITEPQAGSDINALTTTATLTDKGFILKGHKRFITNSPIADTLVVYAKLEGKLTAFLVKNDDKKVFFTDNHQITGCSSATMGDVLLESCLIPSDRRLGKIGAGPSIIQNALELERAFVFAGISGIMSWQLETIVKYSRERQVNGVHLGQNQAISHKIADMKLRLDTINLWLYECARLKMKNKRLTLASAQTKLYASESFLQSSLDAIQIMGTKGLLSTHKMNNLVHDALASRLFSGSSEIQKNMIAALLGTGEGYQGPEKK